MVAAWAVVLVREDVQVPGSHAEDVDLMFVDDVPEPAGSGVDAAGVHQDDGAPPRERSHLPVTQHPPAGHHFDKSVTRRTAGVTQGYSSLLAYRASGGLHDRRRSTGGP